MHSRSLRSALAALMLAGALTGAAPAWSAQAPSMPEGLSAPVKPAAMPAFELPTTAGGVLRSASLKGQVLVIRFWASW